MLKSIFKNVYFYLFICFLFIVFEFVLLMDLRKDLEDWNSFYNSSMFSFFGEFSHVEKRLSELESRLDNGSIGSLEELFASDLFSNCLFLDNIKVTSFCSKGITASGSIPNEYTAAVSRDIFSRLGNKFGNNIVLFERTSKGNKYIGSYSIEDLVNERLSNVVDIFSSSCQDAVNFGVRKNCFAIVY